MDDGELSSDLAETLERHRTGGSGSETLALSATEAYVGDTITLKGRNFPPDSDYRLVWNTVAGEWGVLRGHEIVGPQYQPRTEPIGAVTTDDDGAFDTEWTIPEDHGGGHRIAVKQGEATVATAEVEVIPWFEIDRTEAALGESFVITGYGLGPAASRNNYQIAWDQGYVGLLTGVKNRGTATAEIRAVGPPGTHLVQVWRNYRGVPYVTNNTQSPIGPVAGGRQSVWTVEVTPPNAPPESAWVDPMPAEEPIPAHYPDLDEDTDATLEIAPTSGPAGTDAILTGRAFPPDTEIDLRWYQHVGEGIRGTDVVPKPRPDVLSSVRTDEAGAFELEFEIPVAEGSTRPIVAAIDDREVAVTGFMVQPAIETFEPTSGPVGTEIEIELSGIGWTNYESAPFFVYDNKLLGYGCGMTEDYRSTTVRTVLRAAGEPGYHFIDIYPSLFRMEDDEPEFEVRPHLSYQDNHPVRPLPACHLTFEVTE